MKRIFLIALTLMLVLSFTGCQSEKAPSPVSPSPTPTESLEEPNNPLIVQSGKNRLIPTLYTAWEHRYSEHGWLMMDMANVLDLLPDVKLPVLDYETEPVLHMKKNIFLLSVQIFDENFTEIRHRSTDLSHTAVLPEGSYTILLTLKESGDYIESENAFEEVGYKAAFILKK